jgi:hypothetical protein
MKTPSSGTVHQLPPDLRRTLVSNSSVQKIWESLTPLARNEWICWIISVKKEETRQDHIRQLVERLNNGKRRPCCWIGCIHRDDKAISPSIQGILEKRSKKK